MNKDLFKIKPCSVVIEQCTPKAQLALSAELRNVIHERNILTSRTKKKLVTALDEINLADRCADIKRETRKNQAIQEILDSELVYLKQLEIIMTYFMKPIRQGNVVSNDEYETLFKNIENIYKVNGELVNELKQDLTNVASAFSKLAPFFKMYSVYAYNYKNCLNLLEKLHLKNEVFCKLLVNQETRPEVQAKLSSMLITPIQRIPRYCLLLKQVLENTSQHDSDRTLLKDSLKKLKEVARHVNALVDDRENCQRLLELLRCLKNGQSLVIKPGRKLIKEGILFRLNDKSKASDKLYVVLMSDILMLCKLKKSNITLPNSLKCTCILPLNKCKMMFNNNSKMFEITCQEEIAILYHANVDETDKWVTILNESIKNCIKNRQTLRKGSSSRRPASVYKNEFVNYMDVGVSPGVSRIKKRRRTDEDNEEEQNEKVLKLDETIQSKSIFQCIPRLSKRKTIREINESFTNSPNSSLHENKEGKDSLFPLRQHLLCSGNKNKSLVQPNTQLVPYQPNVFVFGRNNENRRFSFKISNIFSGIGSSLKKVFGFK